MTSILVLSLSPNPDSSFGFIWLSPVNRTYPRICITTISPPWSNSAVPERPSHVTTKQNRNLHGCGSNLPLPTPYLPIQALSVVDVRACLLSEPRRTFAFDFESYSKQQMRRTMANVECRMSSHDQHKASAILGETPTPRTWTQATAQGMGI